MAEVSALPYRTLTRFGEYCARATRIFGERFDCRTLTPKFVPYFNSGQRVRVRLHMLGGETLTGTISATCGWAPQFMLMRTSRSIGSCLLLDERDEIVAVKAGRKYAPVAEKKEG